MLLALGCRNEERKTQETKNNRKTKRGNNERKVSLMSTTTHKDEEDGDNKYDVHDKDEDK